MITITKEFTKEQLQQIIETDHVQCGEASALARIALASLEAEAVAYIFKHPAGRLFWALTDESNKGQSDVMPVYTAPPAPVSVPDAMEMDDDFDSAFEHGKAVGWNAYRAAMLQAEPVSNSDELPLDYLQGHKDGLEWAAQLAEANHPQTGDWLYDDPIDLARAIRKGPDMPTVQAGNSPVTPDGWISCSERMPEGYADVLVTDGEHVEVKWWDESGYWDSWTELNSDIFDDEITHWMPLPEPPLEVNHG